MNRDQIKALALQHGFAMRENEDLRPYVYEFAEALIAAVVPPGCQLVPVEPTREMMNEIRLTPQFTDTALKTRYRSMLAAAPKPAEIGKRMKEEG